MLESILPGDAAVLGPEFEDPQLIWPLSAAATPFLTLENKIHDDLKPGVRFHS
jgi:hypothetical protein